MALMGFILFAIICFGFCLFFIAHTFTLEHDCRRAGGTPIGDRCIDAKEIDLR